MRIVGALGALLPFLVTRWPGIPWEAILSAVGILTGAEIAQRHEDAKTSAASE